MKRQHPSIAIKVLQVAPPLHIQKADVAYEPKVMEFYYRGKIHLLETSLEQLNIQDDSYTIITICKEITRLKKQVTIAKAKAFHHN